MSLLYNETSLEFLPIYIDEEDVLQEQELAKLEGISNPSRSIIRRRLMKLNREYLIPSDEALEVLEPMWSSNPSLPPITALRQLITWGLQQSSEVQAKLEEFLQDPEGQLEEMMEFLRENGLTSDTAPTPNKQISFTALFLKVSLKKREVSKDELYDLARSELGGNRPEAAVRTAIRRATRRGDLEQLSNGNYRLTSKGREKAERIR